MHTTSMDFKFGKAFSTHKQQFNLEIEKKSDISAQFNEMECVFHSYVP